MSNDLFVHTKSKRFIFGFCIHIIYFIHYDLLLSLNHTFGLPYTYFILINLDVNDRLFIYFRSPLSNIFTVC